jgi:hypothetical protein
LSTSTKARTVHLVSGYRQMFLILSHNRDEYGPTGGLRLAEQGRHIRFNRNRAEIPAEWMADLEAHPEYGKSVWRADDIKAPAIVPQDPIVVDGQSTVANRKEDIAPLENWDLTGARELRKVILDGRVPNPVGALTYEATHRNRHVVIAALSQFIRGDSADESDTEEAPDVIPVPPTTGGL